MTGNLGTRMSALLYGFLTGLTRVVLSLLVRWEVEGAKNVPVTGGVVLVCNHLHLLDPPLVAASAPRRVHPMAKRELFETPLIGWALRPYGAFPVRRFSADIGALRAARAHLRRGDVVMMFPEGTRSKDAHLHPALPGAAMVALLAGSPVVPVAITGTDFVVLPRDLFGWLRGRRPRVRVVFGEPIVLPTGGGDGRHAEFCIDLIMRRVAALLPPSYQGAYGPDSEGQVIFARSEREPD